MLCFFSLLGLALIGLTLIAPLTPDPTPPSPPPPTPPVLALRLLSEGVVAESPGVLDLPRRLWPRVDVGERWSIARGAKRGSRRSSVSSGGVGGRLEESWAGW